MDSMMCLFRTHPSKWRFVHLLTLVALIVPSGLLNGQDETLSQEPRTISGFRPMLPMVPEKNAKTTAEVGNFIDSLGTKDAMFEVMVGQGRLLTLKADIAMQGKPMPVIAVGDPTIVDFQVVGPRQIRLIGERIGVTDLAITATDGETYSFEIQVVVDLDLLRAQLKAVFPDASLKLAQIRDHVIVEGQARDTHQVARILEVINAYMLSVQNQQRRQISGVTEGPPAASRPNRLQQPGAEGEDVASPVDVSAEGSSVRSSQATLLQPQVINLIRVPGSQQVLLKVQIAELNRTALRQMGASFLFNDGTTAIGTNVSGAFAAAAPAFLNPTTTIAGRLNDGKFQFWIDALRRNTVLKILAEPNLVAYNGHEASFLAGGEFPIPVPQSGGAGGGSAVTVEFREFGVRLNFIPHIMDDDVIRLTVAPEVSTIDFALATTLVAGGTPVPGLSTRKSKTTVELREGQTLAMAGLMQVTMDGTTRRIPGAGDLPVIGPMFSNNSGRLEEKELVVMVTPFLVEPMDACDVPSRPGDEILDPNDLEFYLLGRIESRVGRDHRSTTKWDDPLNLRKRLQLEQRYIYGPVGYSE